jgi:trans-2,3-dihydro-3-hydroxyanthranilate isomerase
VNDNFPIFLVDVFAQQRYAGNPLAVIVCAQPLAVARMQKIAAEMNFSETTFVAAQANAEGRYSTRIFTPVREIAFTGHPILGTGWVVRHHLLATAARRVCLNLDLAPVAVDFETDASGAELCWFDAPPMTLGATIDARLMAPALGLEARDIDTHTPIQVIGAGTAAILVPLRDGDALRRSRLDLQAFAALAGDGHPPLVYLFCRETRAAANDIAARFFFEAREVREDPATGNGAAFLGAYLRQHCGARSTRLRIEQGHELKRPSLIHLQIEQDAVRVGGAVVPTLVGELLHAASDG